MVTAKQLNKHRALLSSIRNSTVKQKRTLLLTTSAEFQKLLLGLIKDIVAKKIPLSSNQDLQRLKKHKEALRYIVQSSTAIRKLPM
jgi:hypothetical protein